MKKIAGWATAGLMVALLLVAFAEADEGSEKAVAPPAKSNPYAAPADVSKAPDDATRTKSGLAYKVLTPGKGNVHPRPTDRVTVNYTGWETNGRMFDSSYKRGKPATFPLNRVIKGWTEGLQLMVVGDKVRLWIPPEYAYGRVSRGGRPSGELVFDIELLEIN